MWVIDSVKITPLLATFFHILEITSQSFLSKHKDSRYLKQFLLVESLPTPKRHIISNVPVL